VTATIPGPGTAGRPLRVLSLGAGVQSTALLLAAVRDPRRWGRPDVAVFADTGWEPAAVYAHLDRLEREVAVPAGIPVLRVSSGHIRDDALDPGHRFASMPLYVANPDGGEGMARRQCTSEYKLKAILAAVRTLLGAQPGPDGVPGRVPAGRWAEQWIGISADEAHRALRTRSTRYSRARFPLLEPTIATGLTRGDCGRINTAAGFADVAKSACIGCPFHTAAQWRAMRDHRPAEWADAVAFDAAIRHGAARATAEGQPLRGRMYLHRSRRPLDQAPIDRITRTEWAARQTDLLDLLPDPDRAGHGCSPFDCPNDPEGETC